MEAKMGGSIAARRSDITHSEGDSGYRMSLSTERCFDVEAEWCVERDAHLAAMTTAELVEGITSGEISVNTRVWCEGLECWTRVVDVPELHVAFASLEAEAEAEITIGTTVTPMAVEITAPEARDTLPSPGWPEEWGQNPADGSHAASPHIAIVDYARRSSPAELGREASPFPPRYDASGSVPATKRSPPPASLSGSSLDRSGARWIVGGFAIATAAIGLATLQAAAPIDGDGDGNGNGNGNGDGELVTYVDHRPLAAQEAARDAVAVLRSAHDRSTDGATLSRIEPGQRRLRGRLGPGSGNRR
jgi:hypothetical protein